MEDSTARSLEEELVDKLQNLKKTSTYISGYLDKNEHFQEVEIILENHGYIFSTRTSKCFGKQTQGTTGTTGDGRVKVEDENQVAIAQSPCSQSISDHKRERKISLMFRCLPCIPDMGVPFNMVKVIHKDCKYGTSYWKQSKDTTQGDKSEAGRSSDHERYVKKQRRIRNSFKKDCKATMIIREIQMYPEYSVEEQKNNWGRRKAREAMIQKLHRDLNSNTPPESFTRFWVTVPLTACHNDHPLEGSNRTQLQPDEENLGVPEPFVCTVENGVIETTEVYMDIGCETMEVRDFHGEAEIESANLSVCKEREEEIMDAVVTIKEFENIAAVPSKKLETEVFRSKEFESEGGTSGKEFETDDLGQECGTVEVVSDKDFENEQVDTPKEMGIEETVSSTNAFETDEIDLGQECGTEEVVSDKDFENKEVDTPKEQGIEETVSSTNELESVEGELCGPAPGAINECVERIKGYLVVVNSLAEHCEDINVLNGVEGDLKRILDRFPVMELIGH
ncbi:uncharacterized protein [Amphiura filiformis]|uniref:uncharacterized protein n=1 Tax=Amphiura filiformis TaxID=82378 RepID=UPI003B22746F